MSYGKFIKAVPNTKPFIAIKKTKKHLDRRNEKKNHNKYYRSQYTPNAALFILIGFLCET
jgi:hypothetical protein